MAHAEYPPRDRLSLRAYIRARLRGRGLLDFADDDEEERNAANLIYMNCGRAWYDDAVGRTRLGLEALMATTTDDRLQSIGNTVLSNDEFWSSTGSSGAAAGEALLYRLRQPLGRAAYVTLAVYRALYQHGDPLYPPRKVSFLAGPSPNQLYLASPVYPVRLTEEQQVFALSPTAAVSRYVLVRLHGRRQRQWEDLQYYIAIRHVGAYGDPVDPANDIDVARMARASPLAWPSTRGLVSAVAWTSTNEEAGRAGPRPSKAEGPAGVNGVDAHRRLVLGDPAGPDLAARFGALQAADGGGGGAAAAAAIARQGDARVVSEDVYEAGPQSTEESRRAYVTTTCGRGALWASRLPELDMAEGRAEVETAAPPGPRSSRRPWRYRAVLPSGPTECELRLAMQQSELTRALPHLVQVPWPEVFVARRAWRRPEGAKPLAQVATVAYPQGAAGSGGGGWGRSSVTAAATGPAPRCGRQGGGGAAAAAADAHGVGRIAPTSAWRRSVAYEAAAAGRARRSPGRASVPSVLVFGRDASTDSDQSGGGGGSSDNDGGGGAGEGAGAAATSGRAPGGALQRLRKWVVAAAAGRATRDTAPAEAGGGDSHAQNILGSLRPGAAGGGANGSSTSSGCGSGGGAVKPAVAAAVARLHNGDPRLGHLQEGEAAADAAPELRRREGVSPPRDDDDDTAQAHVAMYQMWALKRGAAHASSEAPSVVFRPPHAAASAPTAEAPTNPRSSQLGHTPPDQDMPPIKLRRRADPAPWGGSAVAGVHGGNEPAAAAAYGGADAQRRRHHHRAAQRAMRPAVYCPAEADGALFVVLNAWAGVGRGGGAAAHALPGAPAAAADGGGDNDADGTDGCWLVSHYDHEHL